LNIILCTLTADATENLFDQIDPDLLSEAEHQRIARFAFDTDRWSFAAAHALLRRLLSEFHGLPPLSWRFRSNRFGRPEIAPEQGLAHPPRFSISHTPGLAVCAVSIGDTPKNMEIGVDAESLQRRIEPLALADRFLSSREAQWLRALPEEQRRYEFIRLWTLKEAIAKATGLGLQMDLKSFHCDADKASVAFERADWGAPEDWELRNFSAAPHHSISLALRRPPATPIKLEIRHLTGKLHIQ
jgi:4'-phosphopantetheinyl transferase